MGEALQMQAGGKHRVDGGAVRNWLLGRQPCCLHTPEFAVFCGGFQKVEEKYL